MSDETHAYFSPRGYEAFVSSVLGLMKDEGVTEHVAIGRIAIAMDIFLSDAELKEIHRRIDEAQRQSH